MTGSAETYDIAVSFAGAQRALVEPVVRACQALGLKVFYDSDNTVESWGRNLITGMRTIYGGTRARHVVPFLSAEYLASDYPMEAFNAAMLRAIEVSADGYILPILVGSVQVPPEVLSPAIGYLRLEDHPVDGLARIIADRVGFARERHQEPREVAGVVNEAFGVAVRVRDARTRLLGVHASIQVKGATGELPPYVARDLDDDLRNAISAAADAGGFVLLVGPSSVGKTRTLVEAVKAVLPEWWLLRPDDTTALGPLAEQPTPQTLLWLNELQPYLTEPGGLAVWPRIETGQVGSRHSSHAVARRIQPPHRATHPRPAGPVRQ